MKTNRDLMWAIHHAPQAEVTIGGLGAGIRKLMESRGVSYRAMASELDVHVSAVQRIVHNRRPLTAGQLTQVCDALSCYPEDLAKLSKEE